MWFTECPNADQGVIRPLVTQEGRVVLVCDSADCAWFRPEEVSSAEATYARGPGWEIAPGIHVTPGTTRWATAKDLPPEWLDRFAWHDG